MESGRRALFGAIVFVGVIGLLLISVLANSTIGSMTVVKVPSAETGKYWRFNGRQKHHFHRDVVLNYVSKRRVPNGPDPIHNRRAKKSRQPPGA